MEQHNASIERLNAIAADGKLKQAFYLRTYRLELNATIQTAETLAAEATDAEVSQLWRKQVRTLKQLQKKIRSLEGYTRHTESGWN